MSGPASARLAAALGVAALVSGCALPIQGEVEQAEGVARYATSYDHVESRGGNVLDRALAECPEKTVKAETACVRQGLDAAHLGSAALITLVPGCRAGQVCHYDHATRDRLGFVRATATEYVRRWRVDLDFRHPAADSAQVPAAVTDRDDFDGAPAPKAG